MDRSLQQAFASLRHCGNSFDAPPRDRTHWTHGLGFPIKDARQERVEYLWFVGDYASYHPDAVAATRAAARVFHAAGLDFGILFEDESNSGNDTRLAGEERLFEHLRKRNLKTLAGARFREIITTDPHSFHALTHEYGSGNGPRRVRHHSQLLSDLILDGALPLRRQLKFAVTYHDPCYLGRYNAIFCAPRRVLDALGLKLVEMPAHRIYAYCCGAGAGRIWMADPPLFGERPSVTRVREASALPGVHTLAVACPKDLVMFRAATRTARLEERLAVKEIAELVDQAMR